MGDIVVIGNLNSTTPAAPSGSLNGTWQASGDDASVYLPPFVASGSSHAPGLVPDPGSTAGSTKFLREDDTWVTPSSGGGGISVPMGIHYCWLFNNSTSVGSGNTFPSFGWEQFGGSFSVNTNTSSAGKPTYYQMESSGSFSSVDTLGGAGNMFAFKIWQSHHALFALTSTGASGQIVWLAMSSGSWSGLNSANPNNTTWGFRWVQGTDTNWQAYVGTGTGTFTKVDTGVAADTNFHAFYCVLNSTGGIDFYIDNAKVATIASSATGFPSSTTSVSFMLVVNCSTSSIGVYWNNVGVWSF
jgi:hypothetical protein